MQNVQVLFHFSAAIFPLAHNDMLWVRTKGMLPPHNISRISACAQRLPGTDNTGQTASI